MVRQSASASRMSSASTRAAKTQRLGTDLVELAVAAITDCP